MQIIDKYLFKLIAKNSLFMMLSLSSVFAFFKSVDESIHIGTYDYSYETLAMYIFFLFPSISSAVLVISIMIGTVFCIAALNSSRELQILHFGSISINKLIFKVLSSSLIICVIFMIVFEFINPSLLSTAENIKTKALGGISYSASDSDFWVKDQGKYFFIPSKKNSNSKAFLFELETSKNLKQFTSGNASFKDGQVIFKNSDVLNIESLDGVFQLQKNHIDSEKKYSFRESKLYFFEKNEKTLNIIELVKIFFASLESSDNADKYLLELFNRLSKPLLMLGMILIAIPFILDFNREISISKRIFLAIFITGISHLISKFFYVYSLNFGSLVILGPFIAPITLLIFGLFLVKFKLHSS